MQSSQGLAVHERKRPIIRLAKDHHEYSSLIDDQQETRKWFFFVFLFRNLQQLELSERGV
jgi:hypothetical protein